MVVVRIKTLFEVVLLFSDSSKYVSVASNLVFIADNLFRFCGRFFVCVFFFFFFIWIVSIMSVSILLRIYFVMHFVLRHNGLLFYFEKKKKQNTIQKL